MIHWVYRLYDQADHLLYVGLSTRVPVHRAREHEARIEGMARMEAAAFGESEAARIEEGRLIDELNPPFNRTRAAVALRGMPQPYPKRGPRRKAQLVARFVSPQGAADLLGVSKAQIHEAIDHGRLPRLVLGPKTIRIPIEGLQRMVATVSNQPGGNDETTTTDGDRHGDDHGDAGGSVDVRDRLD